VEPRLPLLLVTSALSAACERRSPAPCPPEAVLERLHDATFHVDQGDDDARVRRDLAEIRAQAGDAWTQRFVDRIETASRPDAGSRQFEAESIRADLHASACLTREMHERFHRRLPPLAPRREEKER